VEHLLVDVMGLAKDNNVMKALEYFMGEGQVDIYKLTEMTDDQIHNLKFKGAKGALRSFPKGQTTCLITFKLMYWEGVRAKQPWSDELLTMMQNFFEEYEQTIILEQLGALDDPNRPDALPPPPDSKVNDPLAEFNKGIWRDPNSFPEIKAIEQWDNWQWVFIKTAQAQGVSAVLNPKYIPGSAASWKLFDAHQTYMYSVFLLKEKESFLKDIVINQNN